MNWGTKIILALSSFMLFIIGSVVYMLISNKDTLEDTNYYERALQYDETYQRKQMVLTNHQEPIVEVIDNQLTVTFVNTISTGKLTLRRPSDQTRDVSIHLDSSIDYKIPVQLLQSGLWNCILEWEYNGDNYLFEENIYL